MFNVVNLLIIMGRHEAIQFIIHGKYGIFLILIKVSDGFSKTRTEQRQNVVRESDRSNM